MSNDCSSQIEEGLTFSLNVGWLKRLSRKRENVFLSESIILRAFLPRGVPLRYPRYMEPHILGWRPLMLSMVKLRLIYFLFLRPSLMTSMW
ncbi:unnamed protein product [Arctogadus glacialis]